jgi:dihydroxy-acid dehydratase
LGLLETRPAGGVVLCREWVADWAQISSFGENLDALLISATEPAGLAGLLIAALRLDLPTVLAAPLTDPFAIALAALGFAPLGEDPAGVAVAVAQSGSPRPRELVEGFSLANALRVSLSLGAGPELLVHLAAVAREAGTVDFSQMIRVLAPESPATTTPRSSWFATHGAAGLFAYLGAVLHGTPTVAGWLKETLPPAPPSPGGERSRLIFVRGRASSTEVVCRTDGGVTEVSGLCRFCASEEAAVRAVGNGAVNPSDLLVVGGCGPRGGPGLLRLDHLGRALEEAELPVPVLTDGLPPEGCRGTWASLATPEAATGGVVGRLRDGDYLRLDLAEGLIRTSVKADELSRREPFAIPLSSGSGYAARYARTALPALEGAGFG